MAHPTNEFYAKAWKRFKQHKLGIAALGVVFVYLFVGIYAPFFASSKPIALKFEGTWYFPLFRYLFYSGFYSKGIDLFFNLLMFTLPLACISCLFPKWMRRLSLVLLALTQVFLFLYFALRLPQDPASDKQLTAERAQSLKEGQEPTWAFDLKYMNDYARLNTVLAYQRKKNQHQRIIDTLANKQAPVSSLWQIEQIQNETREKHLKGLIDQDPNAESTKILNAKARLAYDADKLHWLEQSIQQIQLQLMPLIRDYHWEEDAGGDQSLNRLVGWLELTRINRKDLASALIFGIRVSLVVGLLSVGLALLIGVPIGAFSGYYGGTYDILINRLLEIWESMPIMFMLLLVVAMLQSKSIFLVITVIGLFGWTTIARYVRGEFLKQRNLSYVEACRAVGFSNRHIIFSEILPNAIPPVLTLLPFAIMAAIMSEAGLSFLGLGEEGSSSWGVLMDEGRTAFPSESYLLWPPAILLTILLISIALVGDALRDAIDPKSVEV